MGEVNSCMSSTLLKGEGEGKGKRDWIEGFWDSDQGGGRQRERRSVHNTDSVRFGYDWYGPVRLPFEDTYVCIYRGGWARPGSGNGVTPRLGTVTR
jgi:hypothetical protein